jgi:hypothetical protein
MVVGTWYFLFPSGMGRKVVLVGKIQGTQKDLERMINEVEMGMMGIENIHKGLLNNSN